MDDLISRQQAVDALNEQIGYCDKALASFSISAKDTYAVKVEKASLCTYRKTLEYMPSAQERKTGRWILHKDKNGYTYGECSECGMRQWVGLMKYCSECGA